MSVKICLVFCCFTATILHAQTPGSDVLSYIVDTIASPTCNQSGDGAILLDSVSIPGTIDRYEWSNGSTMEDLIFVNGGEYQLTVFNTNGRSFKSEKFNIPEPAPLVLNPFISPPTAANLDNGFVDLTIHGGTQPYRLTMIYNHDTATVTTDSTFTISNVDTGTYILSVLDTRGCTDTTRFDVPVSPCGILVTALIEPAECETSATGRIELLIDNAVEPYTIDWKSGTDDRTIHNNLSAGVYGFTIRDRRRCTVSDSIEIFYDDRIPPKALVKNQVLLYLNSKGKANLTKEEVLISAKDQCHNNLDFEFDKSEFNCSDVGTKEIEFYISDGAGNTNIIPIQVEVRDTQSLRLVYEDTVYTALCNGIAQYKKPQVQGSCSTTSAGGIVKATTREISSPGTYMDTYYYVKKPGDTLTANVTVIVANTNVRSFLIVEEPQCSTGDDGSVVVALRNSKEPISYKWDDGSDKDYIFGLTNQREYSVVVSEGNGCTFELSAFIEGPDSLKVDLQNIIEKENSIDIITQVSGGNRPLRYAWYLDGKVISESMNLLGVEDGKIYKLLVTDALGCVGNPLMVNRIMTSTSGSIDHQIDIYPSPNFGNTLHIRFNQNHRVYSKIRLVNSQQKILKESSQLSPVVNISLKSLPPGLYFVQFFKENGVMFSKKFVRM